MLILFDIDGTLLELGEAHHRAFTAALKEVHGLDITWEEMKQGRNSYAGWTDWSILLDIAQRYHLEDARLEECMAVMNREFPALIAQHPMRALPGVPALLDALERGGHRLGLVTGNLEPIAHEKLRSLSLDHYFSCGGFGNESMDRAELVRIAMRKAAARPEEIAVMGDTPFDVAAAKAAGARAIAVATGGKHAIEELGDADIVLKDLRDTAAAIKAIVPELLDIVDEDDNVTGTTTKEEKIARGHITRTAVVFLVHEGKVLLGKRSPAKKTFPGLYDVSACGNVSAGESYEEAARRELREELGVEGELRFVAKLYQEMDDRGRRLRHIAGVFLCDHGGPINGNDETVELVWVALEEAAKMLAKHPQRFTPGLANELPLICARGRGR